MARMPTSLRRPAVRIDVAAVVTLATLAASGAARADGAMALPFGPVGPDAAAPWHVTGLPQQTKPYTKFTVVDIDGHRAVRVEATESYGNLVHPLKLDAAHATLSWRWRVDELLDADDLRKRGGDDTALKVCVSFDLALDKVPFLERQLLRVGRSKTDEPVPAATVCYVWDAHLPVGTMLDNAFTRRIRYVVLRSGSANLRSWVDEKRDVGADFVTLFGAESPEVPTIIGVLVGADSDNTHGHSLAYAADLKIEPAP